MRSRYLAVVAFVGATALTLTACSNSARTTASAAEGSGDVGGKISISWWGGTSRNEKTNAVIDMFEDANPDVTTDRQSADWDPYWDKLNIQAAGSALPCAVQVQSRQLNDYTRYDLLRPLDPLIESGEIDVSNIPKTVLDTARGSDGKLYFLPYGAAYDSIGINKSLARSTGVGVPRAGYTWDEFWRYLKDVDAKLPHGVEAADSRGGNANLFFGWALANGIDVFGDDGKLGFTEGELKEYWSRWLDLSETGVTVPPDRTVEEPTGPDQGYFAMGDVFSDGIPGNALSPAAETLAAQTGQKMTTIRYPSGPGGSGNGLFPSGFAISKSCDNVATAAAFIDFFTNDVEAGKVFAADNGAPTNTAVLAALLADDSLPSEKRHELEMYQQIVTDSPPSIIFPAGYQATFEAAFTRAYEKVSFGEESLDDAVKSFFADANASLGE